MQSHPTRPRAAERNISALADIFLSVALLYKKGVHSAHPFMIAIINRYCKSLFDTAERYTAYDIP